MKFKFPPLVWLLSAVMNVPLVRTSKTCLLLYMMADNDTVMEGYIRDNLEELSKSELIKAPDLTTWVYYDGHSNSQDSSVIERLSEYKVSTVLSEQNSDLPETVSNFVGDGLADCKSKGAQDYMIIFNSHGRGFDGFGGNHTSRRRLSLTNNDIAGALRISLAAHLNGKKFDVVGFDGSYMQALGAADDYMDVADHFLASEALEPGHGWWYEGAPQEASSSAMDIARYFQKSFLDVENGEPRTLSIVNLNNFKIFSDTWEVLSTELTSLMLEKDPGVWDFLKRARNEVKGNFWSVIDDPADPAKPRSGVDILSFMEQFKSLCTPPLDSSLEEALVNAAEAYAGIFVDNGNDNRSQLTPTFYTGMRVLFPTIVKYEAENYTRDRWPGDTESTPEWVGFLDVFYNHKGGTNGGVSYCTSSSTHQSSDLLTDATIVEINNESQNTLKCPGEDVQIDSLNAGITGCGLDNCDQRYSKAGIKDCAKHCAKNSECVSYSWAPVGGNRDDINEKVCTIYNTGVADQTLDSNSNQILCARNRRRFLLSAKGPEKSKKHGSSNKPESSTNPDMTNSPKGSKAPNKLPKAPSKAPSNAASYAPSKISTKSLPLMSSSVSSSFPTAVPSSIPSLMPSFVPSSFPTAVPSSIPSLMPSFVPSSFQTTVPSSIPSHSPSLIPSSSPSDKPSTIPSSSTTDYPTNAASNIPSNSLSSAPSIIPSTQPSSVPTTSPSSIPSILPFNDPTSQPSSNLSVIPSTNPNATPSVDPSQAPISPSTSPSASSSAPSLGPSTISSSFPTVIPSYAPSIDPSLIPSSMPHQNTPEISEIKNEAQNTLKCPGEDMQIGSLNAGIPGCGLESCDQRYSKANIEECASHCAENSECVSYSWAPVGGNRDDINEKVCTIYNTGAANQTLGSSQILCFKKGPTSDIVLEVNQAVDSIYIEYGFDFAPNDNNETISVACGRVKGNFDQSEYKASWDRKFWFIEDENNSLDVIYVDDRGEGLKEVPVIYIPLSVRQIACNNGNKTDIFSSIREAVEHGGKIGYLTYSEYTINATGFTRSLSLYTYFNDRFREVPTSAGGQILPIISLYPDDNEDNEVNHIVGLNCTVYNWSANNTIAVSAKDLKTVWDAFGPSFLDIDVYDEDTDRRSFAYFDIARNGSATNVEEGNSGGEQCQLIYEFTKEPTKLRTENPTRSNTPSSTPSSVPRVLPSNNPSLTPARKSTPPTLSNQSPTPRGKGPKIRKRTENASDY